MPFTNHLHHVVTVADNRCGLHQGLVAYTNHLILSQRLSKWLDNPCTSLVIVVFHKCHFLHGAQYQSDCDQLQSEAQFCVLKLDIHLVYHEVC